MVRAEEVAVVVEDGRYGTFTDRGTQRKRTNRNAVLIAACMFCFALGVTIFFASNLNNVRGGGRVGGFVSDVNRRRLC